MLKRAEPPICVGLYARWGSGKSFMLSLLVKEFDPTALEHPHTRQLLQHFEKGYDELQTEQTPQGPNPQKPDLVSLISGLLFDILCTMLTVLPTMPYWLSTLCSLIWDDLRAAFSSAPAWWSELKLACDCRKPWDRCRLGTAKLFVKDQKNAPLAKVSVKDQEKALEKDEENAPLFNISDSEKVKKAASQQATPPKSINEFFNMLLRHASALLNCLLTSKTEQKTPKLPKEFVFVNFNAWECASLAYPSYIGQH